MPKATLRKETPLDRVNKLRAKMETEAEATEAAAREEQRHLARRAELFAAAEQFERLGGGTQGTADLHWNEITAGEVARQWVRAWLALGDFLSGPSGSEVCGVLASVMFEALCRSPSYGPATEIIDIAKSRAPDRSRALALFADGLSTRTAYHRFNTDAFEILHETAHRFREITIGNILAAEFRGSHWRPPLGTVAGEMLPPRMMSGRHPIKWWTDNVILGGRNGLLDKLTERGIYYER